MGYEKFLMNYPKYAKKASLNLLAPCIDAEGSLYTFEDTEKDIDVISIGNI